MSRPTLREALRLLSSAHLIRATKGPGGGIFVAATPEQGIGLSVTDSVASMLSAASIDIDELIETRMLLEIPLAGLAAQRATEEDVAALHAILDAAGEIAAGDRFRGLDTRLHGTIAAIAGNRLARAFTEWIGTVLQPPLHALIEPAVVDAVVTEQHRDIVRAIERGDPTAAERAMREHLVYLQDLVGAVRRARRARTRQDAMTGLFAPLFAPARLREALSDRAWIDAMLDDRGRARGGRGRGGRDPRRVGGGDRGRVPARRGRRRRAGGRVARSRATRSSRSSSACARRPAADAAGHVHLGATSQDVLDTAAMLVARRALALVTEELDGVARACAGLAREHAGTLMAGRTLLQQALPVTFGLKAAGWLDATLDARAGLGRARFDVQLGGAAGHARGAGRGRAAGGRGARGAARPRRAGPAVAHRARARRRAGRRARGRRGRDGQARRSTSCCSRRPRSGRWWPAPAGPRRCRTSRTRSARCGRARARRASRRSPRCCSARWRRSTSAPPGPGTRSGSR